MKSTTITTLIIAGLIISDARPACSQNPTIASLPIGIQRGVPSDLVITGSNLANPTGVSLGIPAKIAIPTDENNGSDPAKFKVRINVPADTSIGWYPFRVATAKGMSNLRVLCIDDLPQVASNDANHSKETAQAVPVPCTVAGSINANQADFYKITVKAGQRLSFDCLARRLGSTIDACMYLHDAKGTRELAYDNDSPGCQTDPRISFTFKNAGEYLLEVKDVQNRGGPEFFYRIRIGDFPMATTPIPMAARRGSKVKLAFAGPAVDGAQSTEIEAASDPAANVMWVSPKNASGLCGWPVPLTLSDYEEAVESEPNNDAKSANRIAVPGGITGRFLRNDDVDCFVFAARKGQKLTIQAHTRKVYSPTLVSMILRNAQTNAEIAKSNPQATPPGDQRIDFTAADDGDFVLEVQHLHFAGGPSESYRITIEPPLLDFDLVLPTDRFDVPIGGTLAIPVQIVRKGYQGPITIFAQGQAGFDGTLSIRAGQNTGILRVAAAPDMPRGAYQFNVVGTAKIDWTRTVEHYALAQAAVTQALGGLPYPPMDLPTFVAVAVTEKAPFSLAVKMEPAQAFPGGKVKIIVTANRDSGFDGEITLNAPTGLPPTIPVPKSMPAIEKGKTKCSFMLDLNPKTPLGAHFVTVGAKGKHQDKEIAANGLLLVELVAPFELKVEPAEVLLKPGRGAKLKVTAIRHGGYKGPIALELRKLPPMVTVVGKAIINADQTTTEVEIAAGPKTAAGTATVEVAGSATGLNSFQQVSSSFSLRVEKK